MLAGLLLAALPPVASADDFDLIVERQHRLLLTQPPSTPPAVIDEWVHQLDFHGAWPDINYQDTAAAEWSPRHHLERVVIMCQAWLCAGSALRGNAGLAVAIDRALDYWIANRPQCRNWWHNQIGTPGFMRDVILLLGNTLGGQRRVGALEVLNQLKVAGSGANLVWSASLAFNYGCLTKNEVLVSQSVAQLTGEMHVSRGEGIQSDFSFHQHGPRLQTFHYGGAYEHDAARLAWILSGTRWAVPPDKIRLLAEYLLQGQQWMSRWNYTVPSTIDRAVSRPGSMRVEDMAYNASLLAEVDPAKRAELLAVRTRVTRQLPPLNGFRSYPRSDFACYQRPDFSFFVKTISTRTLGSEMGMNGENTKGWHLDCGDTYILRNGDEYEDLMPAWDWSLLPGVTGIEGVNKVEHQPFAGAVGDGECGCAAMHYLVDESPNGGGRLSVRKAYFCHGDAAVCLLGGLTAHAGGLPARTALDQRLLRGPVIAADASGEGHAIAPGGETTLKGVQWIYHDGLAYVPTVPQDVTLRAGPVSGTWRSINVSGSAAPVSKPMFLPFLTHGPNVENASAGYAIFPCANPSQAADRARTPGYRVVHNDASCQMVRWDDGTLMAAFYAPGEVRENNGPVLGTDQPCLVLYRNGHLRAADPLQQGAQANITVGSGPAAPITLPADGTAVDAP